MNRQLIIAIIVGLFIVAVPQSRYVYCQMINTAVDIPKDYQKKLIKNQAKIDNFREQANAVYKDSQRLVDELLIMNGIRKKDGEKWTIRLENGIWKIYKNAD